MSVIDIQIIIPSLLAQHTDDVVRCVSLIEVKLMTQKETKIATVVCGDQM